MAWQQQRQQAMAAGMARQHGEGKMAAAYHRKRNKGGSIAAAYMNESIMAAEAINSVAKNQASKNV